jgi:hypothetical protein
MEELGRYSAPYFTIREPGYISFSEIVDKFTTSGIYILASIKSSSLKSKKVKHQWEKLQKLWEMA